MERLNRRTLQSEDDKGTKKKRNLFAKKDSVKDDPVDEMATSPTTDGFRRITFDDTDKKTSGPQTTDYEPKREIPSHPSQSHPRRTPNNGTRKPYDELSMAVKVRNRSGAETYPGMGAARSAGRTGMDDHNPHEDTAPTNDMGGAVLPNTNKDSGNVQDGDWRGGTWEDSGYSATDEEAHRNVVYTPPNFLTQTFNVMFAQMKSFSKGKALIILIAMIALIPVIVFLIPNLIDQMAASMGATISNAYTGLLLVFLPLILALFTAKQCGTQIPNEFKERTVYMSIPLPMSRLSFYFGKYLAGFLYCLALFLLAFGVAVACTSLKFDSFYSDILLEALVGTIVAILVYSSTAFCIGCFMNRGSVLVPLILNLIVFPCLFYYIGLKFNISEAFLMPVFLPDAIIQSLGFPMSASLSGMLYLTLGIGDGAGSMWSMCAIGLVWSICFLALGAFRITRRET